MEVGIRELKAKLSSFVKRASSGEVITITDHGSPVAIIAPVPGLVSLEEAAAQGWVSPAVRPGLRPVKRHPARGTVKRALDEDRAE